MLRHKHTDRICCIVLAATLLLTCAYMGAAASGLVRDGSAMGYEEKLFDQSRVHVIDIVMEDWDVFLSTCQSEEYSPCTLVIDGEAFGNAAIRGKGNTSLTSVSSYGNDRYSFKVEFDHYETGKTYYGLDKLSLNNLIQDATFMKDYLAYTLMGKMGVAAPLTSFVQIRVNGEAWGLYLAVEAVEDSFLTRNYGSDHGELYKPDSMSFGGGRGNGRDFNMDAFREQFEESGTGSDTAVQADGGAADAFPGNEAFMGRMNRGQRGGMQLPGGGSTAGGGDAGQDAGDAGAAQSPFGFAPDGFGGGPGFGQDDPGRMTGEAGSAADGTENADAAQDSGDAAQRPFGFAPDKSGLMKGSFDSEGFGGRGSSDVMLQYSGEDAENYSNIFDNAKTDVTEADQTRLIESLRRLSEGETIGEKLSAVDAEAVIRYLVVHDFLVNGDSYTGSMIHNYYLYEEDGALSMIPWDYNLSMGAFHMGGSSGASAAVNSPIDTPVSSGDISSRPIISWIFESEEYTRLYHEAYEEFIETVSLSGWLAEEIERVYDLIAPYVKEDANAFFTYDEFLKAMDTLTEFVRLRAESVKGQLEGSIPSTAEGQAEDSALLIDASHIRLSDMGSMSNAGGGMGGFDRGQEQGSMGGFGLNRMEEAPDVSGRMQLPGGMSEAPAQHTDAEKWMMLALCAAVLLTGVVIAAFWKNGR